MTPWYQKLQRNSKQIERNIWHWPVSGQENMRCDATKQSKSLENHVISDNSELHKFELK